MAETLKGGDAPMTYDDQVWEAKSARHEWTTLMGQIGELEAEKARLEKRADARLGDILTKTFEVFKPRLILDDNWLLLPACWGGSEVFGFSFDLDWAEQFLDSLEAKDRDWDFPKDRSKCFGIVPRSVLASIKLESEGGPVVKVDFRRRELVILRCLEGVWEVLCPASGSFYTYNAYETKQGAMRDAIAFAKGKVPVGLLGRNYRRLPVEKLFPGFWDGKDILS